MAQSIREGYGDPMTAWLLFCLGALMLFACGLAKVLDRVDEKDELLVTLVGWCGLFAALVGVAFVF